MVHTPTGYRYVTHPVTGWNNLCQNILFREDLCAANYAQVCYGECPADYVCLGPFNVCLCDELEGEGGRPAMPGSIPYTADSGNCCGSVSGSAGWDATLGGWHDTLTLPGCTGTVELLLRCAGGIGQDYVLDLYNATGSLLDANSIGITPNSDPENNSCYPFLRVYGSPDLANACAAEDVAPINFTFLEALP